MSKSGISTEGASIVARGEFDPLVLSPYWFHKAELVGPAELDAQETDFITPEGTNFRLGWLEVNVSRNILQMTTSDVSELERLRDAFIGTISALENCLIGAIGINRYFHVTVDTIARWHRIGHTLVPQNNWAGVLEEPGMRAITVWGRRPDHLSGRVQVQVEPSQLVPQSVFISHNDHFSLSDSPPDDHSEAAWEITVELEPTSAKRISAISILADQWNGSMRSADELQQQVVRLGDDDNH